MISLLKPVLSYFLLNTSGYQTQLAHSDKNHFSLNEILKNDDFFNFLPHLNHSYIDDFNSVSKTPLTDFLTPNCYKNFTPRTDISNLVAYSSKTLISFNCESSQRPYLRKVKFESTQDPNSLFLEFDCVDELSNGIPTVQGASFYAFLGSFEIIFYTLMLVSLLNYCFHSNHHVQNDENRNNNRILENNDENINNNYPLVYFINNVYNRQKFSCFAFKKDEFDRS